MDFNEKFDLPNPQETTNPISKLFFWWMFPLFKKGYKQDLSIDDMYNVLYEDRAERLGDRLQQSWDKHVVKAKNKGHRPKFYKAIISSFGSYYVFLGLFLAIDEWIIRIAQTLYLKWLIESFSLKNNDPDKELKQYLYAAGVCLTTLIHTLVIHPTMFEQQHVGMKCRIASSSMIYRKALRLSKSTQDQTTVGQLINLLSNDVNRFDISLFLLPYIYLGPIQMIIFTYFLYEELGPSCLAGTGFVCLLMPVQYYIGKLFTIYRYNIAKKTDERGRIMNEIIIAIRVIKMYAWEKPFSKMINNVRRLEVKVLRKTAYLRAFYLSLFISSAKVITFLTFLTYVLTGHTLTANKVFFAVSVYNVMRQVMISYVPVAAAGIGELIVSMNRIETFLLLDEQKISENLKINKTLTAAGGIENNNEDNESRVQMINATANWTNDKIALDRISMDVKGNKLVMVVGPVGSGKTSLLHALLAELPINSGKCFINGKTSYAGQEPWIFSGNLRQNILFGQEFDQLKYDEIVRVCALQDDLKQLPYGDNTIVGERGVALSGGQKARVNLARALYQPADIYLLDDPLSAVDARVSRHIFEKCVKKHLRGQLRILVTHQLQYLPQADHIIVFNEGQILAQGTYKELVEQGVDFVSLLAGETDEDYNRKESIIKLEEKIIQEVIEQEKPEAQVEAMAGGSVNLKLYWEYFSSGDSSCGIFWLFFGFIFCQVLYSFSEYWLSKWTNDEEKNELGTIEEDVYLGESTYIWVYSGLTLVIFVVTKIRAIYFFQYCMKISINVHNRMFGSLVRGPTKFFDENPSGRVMNRFTKDLGSMDELLPSAFFDALAIFLLMIGVLIIVSISNYYIIVATVILVIILALARMFYIKTARHVKRIESVARSPVFTHLAASMQGLTTIRSSGSQGILVSQFDGHQNLHSSAWFVFIAANRWFGIWLEMVSVTFLTAVTYSFILLSNENAMGGNVGLAISSALALTGTFQWGMRQSAETENLMTSVERALEYAKIEPEAELESEPKTKPPKDWPAGGHIRFENVYLAYEDKDVLKDLTFDVKTQEKIGIVGRTGAGKSSIIAALFRMTEPKGNIYIDDILINNIGLHDLRRSISIIPQDPVLFSGTVRYNLDPFDQFKDDELWTVLEEVELKEEIPSLEFKVSDGGNNFSVGQRQLVCLARAILRRNKIIVMDEATANVDPRTDNFIQKTIRSKFADCTIITIAHRLHSVMDCDRILVLDNGYLKEYDHPFTLLKNPNGILSSMVGHTGKASSGKLLQLASDTYSGRRGSFHANTVDLLNDIAKEDITNRKS